LAKELDAELHLVHVVDARQLVSEVSLYASPAQLLTELEEAGARLIAQCLSSAQDAGVLVQGAVRYDPALRVCDLIVAEAKSCKAELIVMGTHGRRGWRRLALGSDAELVVRDSPVPVLLAREPSESCKKCCGEAGCAKGKAVRQKSEVL
jgi:nucleotide-binding universal stress UspA family protein